MDLMRERLGEPVVSAEFADPSLLRRYWEGPWGCSNAVGEIGEVLVHRPDGEMHAWKHGRFEPDIGVFVVRDDNGYVIAYSASDGPPDLDRLIAEHDALTAVLREHGVKVINVDGDNKALMQVFMRDVGMVIPGGMVLSRFLHKTRYGESHAALQAVAECGMPILGAIQGNGYAEGGSFVVLDPDTAVVGRSIRVNTEGIRQLRDILSWQSMELIVVDLPSSLIHLDEAFVMIDVDKALVRPTVLPHWFLEKIRWRGIETISVHADDPPSTVNCLALSPGKVVFSQSGVRTAELLSKHGIEVLPVDVSEINKLGGGIHCATLELNRGHIPRPKPRHVSPV